MAYYFVLFAALVAAARASVVGEGAYLQPAPLLAAEPYDPNPQYSYGYDVQDPLTGDSHGQVETRSGDVVTGSYNLLEADGTRRVVDYSADPINGFNAVVSRQPGLVAAPAVARVAPVAVPAPILRSAPAPIVGGPVPAPILRGPVPAPILGGPVPAPILGGPVPAPILGGPVPAPILRGAPVAPWAGAPVLRSGLPAAPLW